MQKQVFKITFELLICEVQASVLERAVLRRYSKDPEGDTQTREKEVAIFSLRELTRL